MALSFSIDSIVNSKSKCEKNEEIQRPSMKDGDDGGEDDHSKSSSNETERTQALKVDANSLVSKMTGICPDLAMFMPIHQQHLLSQQLLEWWQRSGQSHIFGYSGSHVSLLLQPFRKPKRIRTAFSPGQLLKLEQAFELNQYVIGQERKELAQRLNLTETQVKVWFQNRRTKHKRIRTEHKPEEEKQCVTTSICISNDV